MTVIFLPVPILGEIAAGKFTRSFKGVCSNPDNPAMAA